MIRICSDSCIDIPKDLIEENNIAVIPLFVTLGENDFLDGDNVFQEDIFSYVASTGQLPKTASRSVENFKTFFGELLENDNQVIYIGISSQLSSTYQNAMKAKEELNNDNLFIVDSKSLSSGIGLLVISACNYAKQGLDAKSIVQKISKQADFNQTSFVVDKLDYLYKGGRCSAIARFGANLLKIKPRLELKAGKIENTGKYMGQFKIIIKKYIDDMLKKHNKFKSDICFITHTCQDEAFVNEMVRFVESKGIFEKVVQSRAGATISCHCGENTLGILYLLEE